MTKDTTHRRDAESAEVLDMLSEQVIGAAIEVHVLKSGIKRMKSGIKRIVNDFPDASAPSAPRR